MRLTQEPQLAKDGDNEGIGWQIDGAGRYWQDGGTGGFRSFVGFDPKTRRGVVVLASTSVSVIDHIVDDMYKLLDAQQVKPPAFPTAAQLAPLAGTYELGGQKIVIVARGDRLYLEGGGGAQVGKVRLVPFSNDEFWIEELQSIAAFQRAGDKIARLVFVIGGQQMSAARVP
jgi:hypothetical protein